MGDHPHQRSMESQRSMGMRDQSMVKTTWMTLINMGGQRSMDHPRQRSMDHPRQRSMDHLHLRSMEDARSMGVGGQRSMKHPRQRNMGSRPTKSLGKPSEKNGIKWEKIPS